MLINPLDVPSLKARFSTAQPFPFIIIENFLEPGFARQVADAYPTFEIAQRDGFAFNAVNERKKVQMTDVARFPDPVRQLNDAIAAPSFLAALSEITGIPNLLADEQLAGGGMHMTGPHGRLDVHVDFNVIPDRKLYRRLNILLYLNPQWDERWGGEIELWDRGVKHCAYRYTPILNRCLIFETSDISFHGVAPLTCPPAHVRRSFAAYYYTTEPPVGFRGIAHSTIFRARPDEPLRAYVLMPAERLQRRLVQGMRSAKRRLERLIDLATPGR